MSVPNIQIHPTGDGGVMYVISGVNLNQLGEFSLFPCGLNTVGSVQVSGSPNIGTWSTARVVPIASNDPTKEDWAAHPDGIALTPTVPISIGLSLAYGFFGFSVSVIEGSALIADVYVTMRP